MLEPERGPLARLEPDQIPPFPVRPSFEGIVADALGELPALDARLAGAALWTAENPPDELDAVFNATVGAAAGEVDDQIGAFDVSPFADLIASGDNEDTLRQSVLRYLPPSEAPIETNFEEPSPLT
jgi:hypothetical protein